MYVAEVGEMLRDVGDARRVSSASAVIGLSWSLEREGVDLGWGSTEVPRQRSKAQELVPNSRRELLAQTLGPNCWPKLLAESMPKRRSAPGNAQGECSGGMPKEMPRGMLGEIAASHGSAYCEAVLECPQSLVISEV